jgi:hypothetical protein
MSRPGQAEELQLRVVPLFDGSEKGVHIDVNDLALRARVSSPSVSLSVSCAIMTVRP